MEVIGNDPPIRSLHSFMQLFSISFFLDRPMKSSVTGESEKLPLLFPFPFYLMLLETEVPKEAV